MKSTAIISLLLSCALLTACGDKNGEKEANAMLEQATALFQNGQYADAIATIDSLRREYSKAIETRKKALTLYQEASLKQAQEDLAITDSLLLAAKAEYEQKKVAVEKSKANLTATAEELTDLTLTKMRMDSLQVRFDTECEKIKYIHKKQKE